MSGNKRLIKELYKYLNFNKTQLELHNYNSVSGYFYSMNCSGKDFENEVFSESECPDLRSLLSKVNSDKNIVNKHIKLIKERLDDGTNLFTEYGFIFGNKKITANNIEEIISSLIKYVYFDKNIIFDNPGKLDKKFILSNEDEYTDFKLLRKRRKEIYSSYLEQRNIVLYGPIGSGKTHLLKQIRTLYEIKDVCYVIKQNRMSEVVQDIISKSCNLNNMDSLSKISNYNHSMLILDDYTFDKEDTNYLKSLFKACISVVLVCNDKNTINSLREVSKLDFEYFEIPQFTNTEAHKMIQSICPLMSSKYQEYAIHYSQNNPLLLSLICSSYTEKDNLTVFSALSSLNRNLNLPKFRSIYINSMIQRDAGTKTILGHLKSIYDYKLKDLNKSENEIHLKCLFTISCFGYVTLPKKLAIRLVANLFTYNDDQAVKEIDKLIKCDYLSTPESNSKTIKMSPMLCYVIFSQYSKFIDTGFFTQTHLEKIYNILRAYLEIYKSSYTDMIHCNAVRIFIERTYKLIHYTENSRNKSFNVTTAFDLELFTTYMAFSYCCNFGYFDDAETILNTIEKRMSQHKDLCSSTFSLHDRDLLSLLKKLYKSLLYSGNYNYDSHILPLIDKLSSEYKDNGVYSFKPKKSQGNLFKSLYDWRQQFLTETALRIEIDKLLYTLISAFYLKNLDVTAYHISLYYMYSLFAEKALYSHKEKIYTNIKLCNKVVCYCKLFEDGEFENVKRPVYQAKDDFKEDYLYTALIWISLKSFSICQSSSNVRIDLDKYKYELRPVLDSVITNLKDCEYLPLFLIVALSHSLMSVEILLGYINSSLPKKEMFHFPITEDEATIICSKSFLNPTKVFSELISRFNNYYFPEIYPEP